MKINTRLSRGRRRRRRASHYKTRRRNREPLSAGTFRPVDYRRRWYRVKGVFALTAFSIGPSHVPRKEREKERRRIDGEGGGTSARKRIQPLGGLYISSLNSGRASATGKIHFQVATDVLDGPPMMTFLSLSLSTAFIASRRSSAN